MTAGANKYPRIENAAPAMYMRPTVFSSANRARKLEFEYIGMTACNVNMKPMTAMVYIV